MPDPMQSFMLMLAAAAILAVVAGAAAIVVWRVMRSTSLFRPQQAWLVPWSGWAVLIAFAFALALTPQLAQVILKGSGFFRVLYGPEFPSSEATGSIQLQAGHVRGLWAQTLAIPLQVALILGCMCKATGATLAQMGLSRERAGVHFVLGYLGWLVLAPLCFGIFLTAIVLLTPHPDKHPLLDLGPFAGTREWIAFGIQAAFLAPINEELLFRGLLLPWLLQPRNPDPPDPKLNLLPEYRPAVCCFAAILLSLPSPGLSDAIQLRNWDRVVAAFAPFCFVLALVPVCWLLPLSGRLRSWSRIDSPQALRALIASSILFASIHSAVWPSPIPLFVLGLGLSWLAIRTGSIVPSIVLHMLFNGVAVVYVCIGGQI
jgi:membrane protease YdiL (CAAX protease family)